MSISEMLGDGPSLTVILVGFLGLGLIGFAVSLLRWWASTPVILVVGIWGLMLLSEFFDPSLYPAYSRYPEFLYSATAAILAGMVLPFVGVGLNLCERLYKRDKIKMTSPGMSNSWK